MTNNILTLTMRVISMASDYTTQPSARILRPIVVFKIGFLIRVFSSRRENFEYRVARVVRNVARKMKKREGDANKESLMYILSPLYPL